MTARAATVRFIVAEAARQLRVVFRKPRFELLQACNPAFPGFVVRKRFDPKSLVSCNSTGDLGYLFDKVVSFNLAKPLGRQCWRATNGISANDERLRADQLDRGAGGTGGWGRRVRAGHRLFPSGDNDRAERREILVECESSLEEGGTLSRGFEDGRPGHFASPLQFPSVGPGTVSELPRRPGFKLGAGAATARTPAPGGRSAAISQLLSGIAVWSGRPATGHPHRSHCLYSAAMLHTEPRSRRWPAPATTDELPSPSPPRAAREARIVCPPPLAMIGSRTLTPARRTASRIDRNPGVFVSHADRPACPIAVESAGRYTRSSGVALGCEHRPRGSERSRRPVAIVRRLGGLDHPKLGLPARSLWFPDPS